MAAKDSTIDYIWTDKKRTLFGLPLSFTRYYLTETRLITRVGFFHVEEEEIELYRITDKKLSLSLGQRIFRVGSIILYSKDVDTPEKRTSFHSNPTLCFGFDYTVRQCAAGSLPHSWTGYDWRCGVQPSRCRSGFGCVSCGPILINDF